MRSKAVVLLEEVTLHGNGGGISHRSSVNLWRVSVGPCDVLDAFQKFAKGEISKKSLIKKSIMPCTQFSHSKVET